VNPIKKKLAQYKQNWLDHVGMKNTRQPKQLLDSSSLNVFDDGAVLLQSVIWTLSTDRD
jgi:hypothetical protein